MPNSNKKKWKKKEKKGKRISKTFFKKMLKREKNRIWNIKMIQKVKNNN